MVSDITRLPDRARHGDSKAAATLRRTWATSGSFPIADDDQLFAGNGTLEKFAVLDIEESKLT